MDQSAILRHLAALVACDTQNPPRHITGDSPIMGYCRDAVGSGFEVEVHDHGDGHVSFYAVRGRPHVLFNVHLDTVPCGTGWTGDPLNLEVHDGRATGRGACDIKGAAACLLALAESRPDAMALLFTTDEEGAQGVCVEEFCELGWAGQYSQVVVAEPTNCEAILGHRGFMSVAGRFEGVPGHSSEVRALRDNAIHHAALWAQAALELAAGRNESSLHSATCFNIGRIEGGTANNVIAGEAIVRWSARLRPGSSNQDFLEEIKACSPAGIAVDWEADHDGEPLPASGQNDRQARAFAIASGVGIAEDVDFWTEASIFSKYGIPALVLGPGHIAQAHIKDEWVELAQLAQACEFYGRIISNDR